MNGSGGCSDGVSGVMGAMSSSEGEGGTVLPYLRDVYGTMRWEAHWKQVCMCCR